MSKKTLPSLWDILFFWRKGARTDSKLADTGLDLIDKINPPLLISSTLVINLLGLSLPIMMLQTYDRILPTKGIPSLSMLVTLVLIALIFEITLKIIRAWITGHAGTAFEHATSNYAMNNLLKSKFKEIEDTGSATFLKRMQAIGRLRGFYSGQSLLTLIDIPFSLIYLFVIWYIGGVLILVPLAILGLFVILVYSIADKLKKETIERDNYIDYKTRILVQVLEGIHSVKATGSETFFIRKNEYLRTHLSKIYFSIAQKNNLITNIGLSMGQLMTVAIVYVGCIQVYHGKIGMGGLAAIVMLSSRVMGPIQKGLGLWTRFQDFEVANEQVHELFKYNLDKTIPLSADYKHKGTLELKNVYFSIHVEVAKIDDSEQSSLDAVNYVGENSSDAEESKDFHDEGEESIIEKEMESSLKKDLVFVKEKKQIIKDLSIKIERGESIAITSSKGLGKTTLLNLMAGFYRPEKGAVYLDGIDISTIPPKDLYKYIGFLSEQGEILHGTVKDNLTFFGKISFEDAMDAAEKFGINEAVAVLPNGWETMLHNTPSDLLPPGMKQRICLARVLATHPSILILDQIDVGLDNEGYRKLFEIIGKIKKNITLIMITEDRNFATLADREYHFEEGTLHIESKALEKKILMNRDFDQLQ